MEISQKLHSHRRMGVILAVCFLAIATGSFVYFINPQFFKGALRAPFSFLPAKKTIISNAKKLAAQEIINQKMLAKTENTPFLKDPFTKMPFLHPLFKQIQASMPKRPQINANAARALQNARATAAPILQINRVGEKFRDYNSADRTFGEFRFCAFNGNVSIQGLSIQTYGNGNNFKMQGHVLYGGPDDATRPPLFSPTETWPGKQTDISAQGSSAQVHKCL